MQKAVLAETLQHPLTIVPAAVTGVSALWIALFGLGPAAFAVGLGSGLVSAGAWVFNYFFRGEQLARRHVDELKARRARFRLDEVDDLERAFGGLGHADGAGQARELRAAYTQLRDHLAAQAAEGGSLAAERFAVLADDTYRQGVVILRTLLDSVRALGTVDVGKLRRELDAWRERAEERRAELSPTDDPEADAILQALAARIRGHEQRVGLVERREVAIQQLLAESEALESALERAYLETVDLGSGGDTLGREDAASALERAVAAARRVDDRLRGGATAVPDEELYREAAGRDAG